MEIKTYKKGEVIFREGWDADCMLAVVTGRVGVYSAYGTAEQKLLKEYGPDEFLGEMGLLEREPRSATAVAMEWKTSVEIIDEASFHEFFREKPLKVMKMMQQLSANLRKTSMNYVEVCRELQTLSGKEEL